MQQILKPDQTTSDEFGPASGNLLYGTCILTDHAGGTWTLQVQSPDGVWVTPGNPVTFTKDDIYSNIRFARDLKYRLHGGTAGAKAWISEFA